MNNFKKRPRFKTAVIFAFAAMSPLFFLRDGSANPEADYNLFTSEMAYAPNYSLTRKAASEFLTYPFELVRWPLNHTLNFLEDKKVPAKTRYVFERLEDHGISPKIGFQASGLEVRIPQLLRIEDNLPDNLTSKTWLHYGPELTFKTGFLAGIEPHSGHGFHAFGLVDYEKRSEEHFHGIGPNTSEGDETSYESETTTFEARTGYTLENSLRFDTRIAYRNINISDADDDEKISNYFAPSSIPGLSGDEMITLGTELAWEPERGKNLITTPGKARIAFDYNEGVQSSNARYLKITTELAKSFQLGSPNRSFAVRFFGEHNNHFNGGYTPFHQMARLGGFGGFPLNSHTLRGFERGRFTDRTAALFNFEYRYQIYAYRNWTLTHALFLDEGQTFKDFKSFQFKDFRESYGMGFRLGYLTRIIFDFEIAHADEGTEFYFKNRQPF